MVKKEYNISELKTTSSHQIDMQLAYTKKEERVRETTTEKYLKENGQDLCKFDENIYSCRDQRSKEEVRCIRNMKKNYSKATIIKFLKSNGKKRILKAEKTIYYVLRNQGKNDMTADF